MIYSCPFCDFEHEIEKKVISSVSLVKGEKIESEKVIYYCSKSGEEFVPSKLMNENLLKAKDAYRRKRGLSTSTEIKEIRDLFEMTQKEMSNLFGWGDITIQRYEKKQIQDETYDNMIRMIKKNPYYALKQLYKHKELFSNESFSKIEKNIKEYIKKYGIINLKKCELKNYYAEFNKESDLNGYKILDIDKINTIINYYANQIQPLYKVKLMKLLWLTDALFFRRYKTSLTGLVYRHLPLGAVPIGYNELLYLPSIKVEEEYMEEKVAYRIFSVKNFDKTLFSNKELEILERIYHFFAEKNTRVIVEYMHEEIAYKETSPGEIIPYSLSEKVRELNY